MNINLIILILVIIYLNYLLIIKSKLLINPASISTFVVFSKNLPNYFLFTNENYNNDFNPIILTLLLLLLFIIPFFLNFNNIRVKIQIINKPTVFILNSVLVIVLTLSIPLLYLFKYNFELGWGMAYYNFKGFGFFHFCLLISISIASLLIINRNYKLYTLPFFGFFIIYFLLLQRMTNTFIFLILLIYIYGLKKENLIPLKNQLIYFSIILIVLVVTQGINSQGTGSFLNYLIKDTDHYNLALHFMDDSRIEFSSFEITGYLLKTYVPFSDRFEFISIYVQSFDEFIAKKMGYDLGKAGGIGVPPSILSISMIGLPMTILLTLLAGFWMHYLDSYFKILLEKSKNFSNQIIISPMVGLFYFSFQQIGGLSTYEPLSYFLVILFSIFFLSLNYAINKIFKLY